LKIALVIVTGVIVLGAVLLYSRRTELPVARAARVERASLVQSLLTNGRVEASGSHSVYVQAPSHVTAVRVAPGDTVRQGQLLADVENQAARQELARAEAALDLARADRHVLERGAGAAALAELDAAMARTRLTLEQARQEAAALERLVEKEAAPRASLVEQQQAVRQAEAELAALEKKRGALLGPEDRERVAARLRDAEVAVAQAQHTLRQLELRAPEAGVVFFLALRPGSFLNAGELAARIGQVDRMRVRVYVDEPELGAVKVGQPLRITWDALPGREWRGTVERLPAAIERIGTRSVGEVLCIVDNPGGRLLPEATVNVDVETGRAEDALVIPREAVMREHGDTVVLTVNGDGVVSRHTVRLGIRDAGRVQVLEGLRQDQMVLLPGDRTFMPGERVSPEVVA
jgi:HlyD family secretion protein